MRLGISRHNLTSDENAFLTSLDRQECEMVDPTECAVYADCRDENGKNGEGYRRLAECRIAGALVTAHRVVANELIGVSPVELARLVAGQPGVFAAYGDGMGFVCGPKALSAIQKHELVQNYDDFPALYSTRLPAHYRDPEVTAALRRGAFQVARLAGKPLYVFNTVELLAATLEKLPLGVVVF